MVDLIAAAGLVAYYDFSTFTLQSAATFSTAAAPLQNVPAVVGVGASCLRPPTFQIDVLKGGVVSWSAGTGLYIPNVLQLINQFNTARHLSAVEHRDLGISYTLAFQVKLENVKGRRRVLALDSSSGGVFVVNGVLTIIPGGELNNLICF